MADTSVSKLNGLNAPQRAAVDPASQVWLAASAGTGKTQVLSARVIRLLLEDDVRPENLLCLTFTKAAAAEMAERINGRLAAWVQMKGPVLSSDLQAIGADHGPDTQRKARGLFAKVLDAPGGGLQIMTIHSFCQSLLAAFPEEAGLVPGFETIEGKAQQDLQDEVLANLLAKSHGECTNPFYSNIEEMSLAMGESGALAFLKKCADQSHAILSIPPDKGALVWARKIVGITFEHAVIEEISNRCEDSAINIAELVALAEMNEEWGGTRGTERASKIREWISAPAHIRAAEIKTLYSCFSTGRGEPMTTSKGHVPTADAYADLAHNAHIWTKALIELAAQGHYAERLGRAFQAGRAYAEAYVDAKHKRGVVDFDDMVRDAAALLTQPGLSEWVRYKLDRRIDHILVDESQDTNRAQWVILEALSDDYFSGCGGKAETRLRTIFSVGDYKQAIYGFQGTDPQQYAAAQRRFKEKIQAGGQDLQDLSLSQSYRSTQPILDFVNAVVAEATPAAFGIDVDIADHFSNLPNCGSVEWLRCVSAMDDRRDEGDHEDEESWISSEKRKLAELLARKVKQLIEEKPLLASTGQPLEPGDIMILMRKRGELANLLVARLHDADVPVAGIDRMVLSDALVVEDIISCIRFVLQPGDDLSLAEILVSPLIGWSQEMLLKHGYRSEGQGLWEHLRGQDAIAADLQPLHALLGMADIVMPFAFVQNILSGPLQGRQKFMARLGKECLVPIEELVNLALTFQQQGGSSLQGFLNWFEQGTGEIKREGLAKSRAVKILTVHGAKGLEAPVVILADCAVDPLKSGPNDSGPELHVDGDTRLPMLRINTDCRHGRLERIQSEADERDLREHHRLLYVALTRAQEHLILAGSLGKKPQSVPENSWHALLERAMLRMGCVLEEVPDWGLRLRYSGNDVAHSKVAKGPENEPEWSMAENEPSWLRSNAPIDASPPRPLAPSNLDDDDYGVVPDSRRLRAAERGRILHRLFELYNGSDAGDFLNFAKDWLKRNPGAADLDHGAVLDSFGSIITHSEWQHYFCSNARAEVPLASVVGKTVITGRVDRLVVDDDRVLVIDFKTGSRVPASQEDVPVALLRQMAHYKAALQTIFPKKRVEAALLFTHGPRFMTLSEDILASHMQSIGA